MKILYIFTNKASFPKTHEFNSLFKKYHLTKDLVMEAIEQTAELSLRKETKHIAAQNIQFLLEKMQNEVKKKTTSNCSIT